ncbi:MAG: type II and III secretion system protein [Sporomusaceae bacterium]|nr:type II and III secretion system protein [Sporomusaceae bacterium]
MEDKGRRIYCNWNKILFSFLAVILLGRTTCFAEESFYNLVFVRENLPVVFHTMASLEGVNIVFDSDNVKDKSSELTIKLDHVTFAEAMSLITQSKGLTYRYIGEKNILVEKNDLASLKTIKLEHVMADDLKKSLAGAAEGLKAKVDIDPVSNSLLISGPIAGVERLTDMVAKLDVAVQQVELEAKVLSISKSATKDLGIDWKWDATPKTYDYTAPTYTVTTDNNGNLVRTQTTAAKITRNSTLTNPGVIQFGKGPEGQPYEFYYQATISALVSNGKAQVLAKPKISTVSGKEAQIMIGDKIPVQVQTIQNGLTTTSIQYVDAGIKLVYTPVVSPDGQIFAKVHTEVSTPELVSDIKQYKISTREAETNVKVKDGETMVIGGLIGQQTSETVSKVPFLSDLPILGALFKSVHNTGSDSEIVIFLTAHIVK